MAENKTTRRNFLELSGAALAGLAIPAATNAASAAPQAAASGASGTVDLPALTIADAAARIRGKQLSPVELTEAVLERIAALDPKVGAFITVAEGQARAAARTAETEIQQGRYRGLLHGIPVGLKDTFYTRGIRTTAATAVLKDFIPSFDATIVRRLKDAGAIIIGKTRLPEFSFGGYTPGANNPWDLTRNAGGSSGGSGAALAASMLLGATGGDTSGSIRNPASNCGVVGHKPTFGLVPRYGVVPISWTLDHLGPLARTVEDAAILLKAMAGYDPNDNFSAQVPVPDYPRLLRRSIRGMRAGIFPISAYDDFYGETKAAYQRAVEVIESLGVEIHEVQMTPVMEVASAAHTIIRICDAAAYHRQYLLTQADQYGSDDDGAAEVSRVRTTVEAGSLLTAAQYLRAQQVRRVFIHDLLRMMGTLDVFLSPTMPSPSGVNIDPKESYRGWHNLSGFPAISLPCGFSTSPPSLPIGLQIAAKPFQDATALALAYAYESATDWHQRRPVL